MKILSAILLIIFTGYTVQPVYYAVPATHKMDCCYRAKTGCKEHENKQEKKSCANSGCNMITCITANYFMPATPTIITGMTSPIASIHFSYNDHRLRFISSDCWHPPKYT